MTWGYHHLRKPPFVYQQTLDQGALPFSFWWRWRAIPPVSFRRPKKIRESFRSRNLFGPIGSMYPLFLRIYNTKEPCVVCSPTFGLMFMVNASILWGLEDGSEPFVFVFLWAFGKTPWVLERQPQHKDDPPEFLMVYHVRILCIHIYIYLQISQGFLELFVVNHLKLRSAICHEHLGSPWWQVGFSFGRVFRGVCHGCCNEQLMYSGNFWDDLPQKHVHCLGWCHMTTSSHSFIDICVRQSFLQYKESVFRSQDSMTKAGSFRCNKKTTNKCGDLSETKWTPELILIHGVLISPYKWPIFGRFFFLFWCPRNHGKTLADHVTMLVPNHLPVSTRVEFVKVTPPKLMASLYPLKKNGKWKMIQASPFLGCLKGLALQGQNVLLVLGSVISHVMVIWWYLKYLKYSISGTCSC